MREKIGLLHYDEVEQFFERIGRIDDLKAGKIRCHSCGGTITFNNFRAVFREKGQLFFLCRQEECLKCIEVASEIQDAT